ncbi:MAG: leucyl aminopeptidase [Patescibacteria group bacterium]
MRITRSTALPQEAKADLLIVGVFEGSEITPVSKLDAALGGHLAVHVKEDEFKAKEGATLSIHTHDKLPYRRLALLGLGERKGFDVKRLRSATARAAKLASASKAKTLALWMPFEKAGAKAADTLQAAAEGLLLGNYRYERYKEDKKKPVEETAILAAGHVHPKLFEKAIADARAFADASAYARNLVNTPALEMHPATFVQEAIAMAVGQKRMTIRIFGRKELLEMGAGGVLAVAQGSAHEPKMIHLAYKPAVKAKKRIVLVGKGVTFDSGGLSLKPADGMMDMKIDMAGAAAVLAVFRALPLLKLPVEVHGIMAMVENMPSGTAIRPGDIVKTMSGKTIEILNTDAEGRVTLADTLFYGSQLKPDMMIDLATLTGACIVALGQDITGMLTDDDKLAARLEQASATSGESLWRLPLYAPYADQVKSRHADLKNIGSKGGAGTITAGLFLKEFIGETPSWAHLDIAGPSYNEKDYADERPWGASGYGARLLLEFLRKL